MVSGARQVLTEGFDADESLELIARERATVLHGFDTHYKELAEAHARQPRDVSSVRTGIFGAGMSSSVSIARRARALFGPLVSGYGMSEFGVGVTIGSLRLHRVRVRVMNLVEIPILLAAVRNASLATSTVTPSIAREPHGRTPGRRRPSPPADGAARRLA